ncbi:MAG: isochorismatase family protein [Coriobacteriia bacterium]|nr:isochorismatase family protein [Coriobacteriia bacterium]
MSIARREDAVLVVVDIQERLAVTMERREAVIATTSRLMRTTALVGVPIIVTRQYPKGLGDIEPELRQCAEAMSQTVSVEWADKVAFDCFREPSFVELIRAADRSQLIICGMESHICIAQTALSALRADHEVHVVADACCSRAMSAHETALARLGRAGAIVTTTESVMYELVGAAGTDEFKSLLGIVKA